MNHEDIIRLRLAAHRFADPAFRTPASVVEWMGAIQAQDYRSSLWAIGVRLSGATVASVEAAFDRGDFLRTHVLRPTWHLVPAADIRWMLALSAQKIKSAMGPHDQLLGLDAVAIARSNDVIARALEGGRRKTREELCADLESHGHPAAAARGLHMLMHAELDGVVCSGPMRGRMPSYELLSERAPQAALLPKDEALALLARRYFTSHGPATLPDFTWWSGLNQSEARRGMEAVRSLFVAEKADGREWFFDDEAAARKVTDETVHLLPSFDEYLVAYRDRLAVLPAVHHRRAVTSNGIFRPVVIENGSTVGLWKKAMKKGAPCTVPDFFEPARKIKKEAFDLACTRFSSFLGR